VASVCYKVVGAEPMSYKECHPEVLELTLEACDSDQERLRLTGSVKRCMYVVCRTESHMSSDDKTRDRTLHKDRQLAQSGKNDRVSGKVPQILP